MLDGTSVVAVAATVVEDVAELRRADSTEAEVDVAP